MVAADFFKFLILDAVKHLLKLGIPLLQEGDMKSTIKPEISRPWLQLPICHGYDLVDHGMAAAGNNNQALLLNIKEKHLLAPDLKDDRQIKGHRSTAREELVDFIRRQLHYLTLMPALFDYFMPLWREGAGNEKFDIRFVLTGDRETPEVVYMFMGDIKEINLSLFEPFINAFPMEAPVHITAVPSGIQQEAMNLPIQFLRLN
jgi:hypothetical protein